MDGKESNTVEQCQRKRRLTQDCSAAHVEENCNPDDKYIDALFEHVDVDQSGVVGHPILVFDITVFSFFWPVEPLAITWARFTVAVV